jgi:hypothetical protein
MLTGQRARPGTEREPILEAAKLGTLVPWPDDMPATVELLKAIVDRATAVAADDRYPDARSMLAELDTFIVGERAARKAESPARQLAAWLDEVWAGARDDRDPTGDGEVEGNHLVSFLDDGALDVIGTGTQRSFAATAADDGNTPLPGLLPTPSSGASSSSPGSAPPTVVVRTSAQTAAVIPESERTSAQLAAVQRPATISQVDNGDAKRAATMAMRDRSSRKWFALAIVGVTVVAALVFIGTQRDRGTTGPGSSAVVVGSSGSAASAGSAGSAGSPGSAGSSQDLAIASADRDASVDVDAAGSSSAIAAAGSGKPGRPKKGTANGSGVATGSNPLKAGTGANVQPPALRNVTINATPWAYFTVDADATQHETVKTIQLAPGKHRIHFSNPVLKVDRDVTIDVPSDRDFSHVERLGN